MTEKADGRDVDHVGEVAEVALRSRRLEQNPNPRLMEQGDKAPETANTGRASTIGPVNDGR